MELELYKGVWCRPKSYDQLVVRSVPHDYAILEPGPKDVILDVGANIGAFCRFAADHGAKVIGYEPDTDHCKIARRNCPSAKIVRAALISGDDKSVTFYVNNRPLKDGSVNYGGSSLTPMRGGRMVRVPAENFAAALRAHRPNKIKMDCEGAEYDLLARPLPKHVKALVLEMHLSRKGNRELAADLHASLIQQGFDCIREPILNKVKWLTLPAYRR